jgi:hypothetical protein
VSSRSDLILASFVRRKAALDWVRRVIILTIWAGTAYLLLAASWVWAAVWLVPGLFLVLNLVGFAMLPAYARFVHPLAQQALDALHDEPPEREST